MSLQNSNESATQAHQKHISKHREKELQMQTLYVIGTLTERKTPPAYFNFDGFDGMQPSLLIQFEIYSQSIFSMASHRLDWSFPFVAYRIHV